MDRGYSSTVVLVHRSSWTLDRGYSILVVLVLYILDRSSWTGVTAV